MKLQDKYEKFDGLLLHFLLDTYLPPDKRKDHFTIKKYCKKFGKKALKQTINEGNEVLKLDPFPWRWIQNVTNCLVYDKEKKEYVEDPESYKIWIAEILELLEKEAKKQGKL